MICFVLIIVILFPIAKRNLYCNNLILFIVSNFFNKTNMLVKLFHQFFCFHFNNYDSIHSLNTLIINSNLSVSPHPSKTLSTILQTYQSWSPLSYFIFLKYLSSNSVSLISICTCQPGLSILLIFIPYMCSQFLLQLLLYHFSSQFNVLVYFSLIYYNLLT